MRVVMVAVVALALGACGEGGGESGQAGPAKAPKCEVPADLACPDGMETQDLSSDVAEVTRCTDGVRPYPMLAVRNGEVMSYSAPPFDTMVQCWPPAGASQLVAVYSTGKLSEGGGSTTCYRGGFTADCGEVVSEMNEAWGLTQ